MTAYPEHEKLRAVAEISQAQGELLEWLNERGVQRMRWEEWDEQVTEPCNRYDCGLGRRRARQECIERRGGEIRDGEHYVTVTRHHEQWVHDRRSIESILAEFHGIDRDKLETEKRAMLDDLRAMQAAS